MNKQNFDVNSLRIASPCSVRWETMAGDERVRHCHACRHNVFNVAEMSKVEVENLIVNREGRVCLRLYRRTDGTILTKDCPVGMRAARKRIARLAGAALTAVFGLFTVSFGQKQPVKSIDASKIEIVRTAGQNQGSDLTGIVKDPNGAVIPDVEIRLTSSAGKKIAKVKSDENGQYSFKNIPANNYILEAQYPQFDKYRIINLIIKDGENVEIEIDLRVSGATLIMGIFADEPLIDVTSSSVTTKITPEQMEKIPH